MDDPVRMTVSDVRIRVPDLDPGLVSDRTVVRSPDRHVRRARAQWGSTRDPELRKYWRTSANSSKYSAFN